MKKTSVRDVKLCFGCRRPWYQTVLLVLILCLVPKTAFAIPITGAGIAASTLLVSILLLIIAILRVPAVILWHLVLKLLPLRFRRYVLPGLGIAFVLSLLVPNFGQHPNFGQLKRDVTRTTEKIEERQISSSIRTARHPLIIDIRDPKLFFRSHILGALSYSCGGGPLSPFEPTFEFSIDESLSGHAKYDNALVYCKGIHRSKIIQSYAAERYAAYEGAASVLAAMEASSLRDLLLNREASILGAVWQVPSNLADFWTRNGTARRYMLSYEDLTADPNLDLLTRFFRSETTPVVVYLDRLVADEIEARLDRQIDTQRYYVPSKNLVIPVVDSVYEERFLRPLPNYPEMPKVNGWLLWLRGIMGNNIWLNALVILLTATFFVLILRGVQIRWYLDRSPPRRSWAWILTVLVGTFLLITRLTPTYLKNPILNISETIFSNFFIFSSVISVTIFILLYLNLTDPPQRRLERILAVLRSRASSEPQWLSFQWQFKVLHLLVALYVAYLYHGIANCVTTHGNVVNLGTFIALLALPLLVDSFLCALFSKSLSWTKNPFMKLLRWAGVKKGKGRPDVSLETFVASYPGRFRIEFGGQELFLGIWTGRSYPESGEPLDLPEKSMRLRIVALGRRVQRILRSDAKVECTSDGTIVHVEPIGTRASGAEDIRSFIVNSFSSLALLPDDLCLDATGYEDVGEPTPLSLDVLQARWGKGGGVPKALGRFGVVVETGPLTGRHLVALGKRVYRDMQSESRLFRKDPLRRVSTRVIEALVRLQIWGTFAELSVRVKPGVRARISRVEKNRGRPLSLRKRVRNVERALEGLRRQASFWPALTVFLHEMAYTEMKSRCLAQGLEVDRVIAETMSHRPSDPQPDTSGSGSPLPGGLRNALRRWHVAEQLRQDAHNLFQREWTAVWTLVHELGASTGLGKEIDYLHRSEISRLKRGDDKCLQALQEIAGERAAQWRAQAVELPVVLTAADFEGIDFGTHKIHGQSDDPETILSGTWAAGGKDPVEGIVRNIRDLSPATAVREGEIALVHRLDTVTVLSMQGAAAVIAEVGGVLGHPAIVAREIGLPLIVSVRNACVALEEGVRIRIQPDGRIVRLDDYSR